MVYSPRRRRAKWSRFCPASNLYAVTTRIRSSRSVKTTASSRPTSVSDRAGSRPVAVNAVGPASGRVPTYTTPLDCSRLLRVAGTLASEVGGTVKLDEPGGATQTNSPVAFDGRSTPPPKTITVWLAGAPLQFTVKPWLRVMEDVWARLLQVSGAGKVKFAAMAPTSAPPAPVSGSGTFPRNVRLSCCERTASGFALWSADPPAEPGVRHRRCLDAGDRDRRPHRAVELGGRCDVEAAAVWRAGTDRPGSGETAGRGPKRHLDAELSRLGKTEHGLRVHGRTDRRLGDAHRRQ